MGMKKHWLCGAVIVLGALAVATSASAECAWVLWVRAGTDWQPFGYPSAGACTKFLNEREASARSGWSRVERTTTTTLELSDASKGRFVRAEYRCLPDTVDPRGPKGK